MATNPHETNAAEPRSALRTHRWLLLLPFVWQVGFAPWANGVGARPFELPFPMAWQMAGIVFTTLVIAAVYALDRRADRMSASDAPNDAGAPDGERRDDADARGSTGARE